MREELHVADAVPEVAAEKVLVGCLNRNGVQLIVSAFLVFTGSAGIVGGAIRESTDLYVIGSIFLGSGILLAGYLAVRLARFPASIAFHEDGLRWITPRQNTAKVPFWQRVQLAWFRDIRSGAVNFGLDKDGQPVDREDARQ